MSKANAEIIELLKALTADMQEMKMAIKELQEDNASAAVGAEKMYKTLNAKFDMFKNLEPQSHEAVQQPATTRRVTRPAIFKKMFLEHREKYYDILYTREEVEALFKDEAVLAKKKESERNSKVASILYTMHINKNNPEGRKAAFESEFDTFIRE